MLNYLSKFVITHVGADGPDDDFRIDWVGDGLRKCPIDHAVAYLASGGEIVTEHNGWSSPVYIRKHSRSGRYYLTTRPDGVPWNNLGHISVHTRSLGSPPRVRKLSSLTQKQIYSLCTDRMPASFMNGLAGYSTTRPPALNPSVGLNALSGLSGVFSRR